MAIEIDIGEPGVEPPYKALIKTIMVGPEGHRFRQEINTLAAGSPTRFLRILSYGLANLKIKKGTSFLPGRTTSEVARTHSDQSR